MYGGQRVEPWWFGYITKYFANQWGEKNYLK
jgi:hypothetical protein